MYVPLFIVCMYLFIYLIFPQLYIQSLKCVFINIL